MSQKTQAKLRRLIARSIAITRIVDIEINEGKRFDLYRERKDIQDQILLLSGGIEDNNHQPTQRQTSPVETNTLRAQQDEEYQQSVRDDTARRIQERDDEPRTDLVAEAFPVETTKKEERVPESVGEKAKEAKERISRFQATFTAPNSDPANIMIKVVFSNGRKAGAFRPTDRVLDLFGFSVCAYAVANDGVVPALENCTLNSTMQTLVLSPSDPRSLGDLDLGKSGVFHLVCSE